MHHATASACECACVCLDEICHARLCNIRVTGVGHYVAVKHCIVVDVLQVISTEKPLVILLREFLSPNETEHMVELASTHMARSKVIGHQDFDLV